MESRLVLEEKYSVWWVQITTGLALSAVVLFLVYTNIDDVLWKGIFRLASFSFLAATVFSGLKVMEGKHSILMEIKDGHLIIYYRKRGQQIGEDIFELDKIKSLYVDTPPSYFFTSYIFLNDRHVVMEQKDSDRPLSLIEIDGRTLALSRETAEEGVRFIARHAEEIQVPKQCREDRNTGSNDG